QPDEIRRALRVHRDFDVAEAARHRRGDELLDRLLLEEAEDADHRQFLEEIGVERGDHVRISRKGFVAAGPADPERTASPNRRTGAARRTPAPPPPPRRRSAAARRPR